ncbi:unnamed protein product [Gadus morhua 'NCC']
MSKRKAPRASNCWVSSLSNQTSKMEFLLNVAIWALLLVHVDSAEAENTTVDTAVLHRSLDYPNSTTLNETSDLDPSTLIQPQAKENTSNDTKIKLPEKPLPKALVEITSHHLSSTTSTTAAAAATTNAAADTTPTSNPPNTEQTLSSTQTPSTPTNISHQPIPTPNTTTTPAPTPSHSSGPAALTSSTSGSSIPATAAPKDVPSTHSARPKITAETYRAGTLATSTTTSSNSSTQTEAHANTPSPLSVEVTEKAVDPLVAGLVSAFIATAVVIILLLFLKLRRRDNRPQFHRLQDLPMDDMMEDAPLSMYSY